MEKQTSQQTQPNRPRYWQAHINALSGSGLNRAEYCRQHKLSYHALVYWQRKFTRKDKRMTLVPVALPTVPVRSGGQPGDAGLKILLPGQIAIAVAEHFSPTTLVELLKILGEQ